MTPRGRAGIVLGLGLAGILGMLLVPPIPQDPGYYRFADDRPWLGIPNFGNVASDLPFVILGAVGLVALLPRVRDRSLGESWERLAILVFFAGVLLTGLGSAYFHWDPDDATLFWDRLPLTLAFMALFATVLGDRVSSGFGRALLPVLLAAGVGSMLWWLATDDLRPYALVQYAPIALFPAMLALFPARWTRGGELWVVLGWYVAAKACEVLDHPIYEALGRTVSGHTIKHLLAGCAPWWVLRWVLRRRPVGDNGE